MGILGRPREFIPSCKPINNTSDGAVQVWECNPTEILPNGTKITVDRPVIFAQEKGTGKISIMDMGGASERQLGQLMNIIKKRM